MTVTEMGKLPMHSKEWFTAAFEGCTACPWARDAAIRLCISFNIRGQADPAYIAVVIEAEQRRIR